MDKAYMNLCGYSDVEPYEVIRVVSEKAVDVRAMKAELDPSWEMDWKPGGFAGHVANNSGQKWIVEPNPEGEVLRVRLRKNGQWHSKLGRHVPADEPRKFFDYNF